jgi:transcription initiation factor IIF auxiliary subunit
MTIEIRRDSHRKTLRRWHWAVWLEDPSAELDQVARVVYELHPTFNEPVRSVDDRASGFRLGGTAWGEFMVHLTLEFRDGRTENRSHWLKLEQGAPSKMAEALNLSTKGAVPTVYLSASLADSVLSARVKAALRDQGIKVVSQEDVAVGSAWSSEMEEMRQRADIGVAVISRETSPWVTNDVQELRKQRTPVIPLLLGDSSDLPLEMRDLKAIRISEGESPAAVANRLIDAMPRVGK